MAMREGHGRGGDSMYGHVSGGDSDGAGIRNRWKKRVRQGRLRLPQWMSGRIRMMALLGAGLLAVAVLTGVCLHWFGRTPSSPVAGSMGEKPDAPDAPGSTALGSTATAISEASLSESEAADVSSEVPTSAAEEEEHEPRIFIDPGHGGEDDGGGDKHSGVYEIGINLAIALLLRDKLEDMGFETVMTREDNATYMRKEDRVEMAVIADSDIFVSIHQNTYEGPEAVRGIETYYYTESEDSRRLSQMIQNNVIGETKASDRGLKDGDELVVVRELSKAGIPSCLIETGFLTNQEERTALLTGEYQEKLAEGIAQGIYQYFYPKVMYLTFDDGPSAANTDKTLDILKERGIRATFFLIGENVLKYPEVARRIVDEGHTIGIHCNRHAYGELYGNVESYVKDFQAVYDIIYEVTGVEAELFRFPGGSVNSYNGAVYKEIAAEMTKRGYIYFDWNASLQDAAAGVTPEELLANAVDSARGKDKVVMLAHDVLDTTVLCLEDVLDSFPDYKMEPLTSKVAPIQFRK